MRYTPEIHGAHIQTKFKKKRVFCPKLVKISIIIQLSTLDPWDPSIRQHLDPENDPLKDCTVKFKARSLLDKGYLSIVNRTENETCNYRCIDSPNGSHLVYAEWIKIVGYFICELNCQSISLELKQKWNVIYLKWRVLTTRPKVRRTAIYIPKLCP
jgi:hypothetical protein